MPTINVDFPTPHAAQHDFITSESKNNVVRAGRRGGKTTGLGIRGGLKFLEERRVLYAAPTTDQLQSFWNVITGIFAEAIESRALIINNQRHILRFPGPDPLNRRPRIRAKTAWNADSLRGDFADELILDEWQLMDEDAWHLVGAPMLIDNDGTVTFIYTPPSLEARSASKAKDKNHAAKMFKAAVEDPEWATFHFPSHSNPYVSRSGLRRVARNMTSLNYRMEIEAEDVDEAPTSLWKRWRLNVHGFRRTVPQGLARVVVGVDPTGSRRGDECGIVVGGRGMSGKGYVLEDASVGGASPREWAEIAIECYHRWKADRLVAEINFGGELVEEVVRMVDPNVSYKPVTASRGKAIRAEPVSALYEREPTMVYHCGEFPALEDQMCMWTPGNDRWSPDRMDALVWTMTELMLEGELEWGPA